MLKPHNKYLSGRPPLLWLFHIGPFKSKSFCFCLSVSVVIAHHNKGHLQIYDEARTAVLYKLLHEPCNPFV